MFTDRDGYYFIIACGLNQYGDCGACSMYIFIRFVWTGEMEVRSTVKLYIVFDMFSFLLNFGVCFFCVRVHINFIYGKRMKVMLFVCKRICSYHILVRDSYNRGLND